MNHLFLLIFCIQILCLDFFGLHGKAHAMGAREEKMVLDAVGEFEGEQAVINVNDRNIFSGEITTNRSNGIAKHLAVDVVSSEVSIKVEFPVACLKLSKNFNLRDGRCFEISIIEGELVINQFSTIPLRD